MSGYSDAYKDEQHRRFLTRWEPKDGWPKNYDETHKWLSARAQAAEATVREIKGAVNTLLKVTG